MKAFAAATAAVVLPLEWFGGSAEAKKDCFNPCLGLVKAAADRELGKCRPPPFVVLYGFIPYSLYCAFQTTNEWAGLRNQCFKPECGTLGKTIKEGGPLGGLTVIPLELPAATTAECQNCEAVGGYCGTCPAGTPGGGFFCGTPPVPPCRYCGGC